MPSWRTAKILQGQVTDEIVENDLNAIRLRR
jgi:hypothetical protein